MELVWIITVGVFFSVAGAACVAAVIFGLPGSWILLGLAVVVELLDRYWLPEGDRQTFNWWLLGTCLLLAALGELLEFAAGALGAKTAGSSKYGVWGALIGGIVGAIAGIFIPVPIVGSLIGALLGSFAGAVVGELVWQKRALKDSLAPATGAAIGRVLGTLSKVPIALAIWLALAISVFWP